MPLLNYYLSEIKTHGMIIILHGRNAKIIWKWKMLLMEQNKLPPFYTAQVMKGKLKFAESNTVYLLWLFVAAKEFGIDSHPMSVWTSTASIKHLI
jgi:hypothetical protein